MDLRQTFAVLAPDMAVTPVDVGEDVYARLDRSFGGFRGHWLVAVHEFSSSWATWERHPAGDEIVMLLEGGARLRVANGDPGQGDERVLGLDAPGAFVVVPAGHWHTAEVDRPTRMLFITPGEGTENRAVV